MWKLLGPDGYFPKGSKRWIQILVNKKYDTFNQQIKNSMKTNHDIKIEWISPRKEEVFREYHNGVFTKLGLRNLKVPLGKFWPLRGPSWDAVGRGSHDRIFLVEAKSHIPEMNSPPSGASEKSISKIKQALLSTKQYLGASSEVDWTGRYYQYANRLAYLYWLKVLNGVEAYLVLVYFLNDKDQGGPSSESEWREAIMRLNNFFGLTHNKLENNILEIFVDVKDLL